MFDGIPFTVLSECDCNTDSPGVFLGFVDFSAQRVIKASKS